MRTSLLCAAAAGLALAAAGPSTAQDADTPDRIVVTGGASQVDLTRPYAGGQIARGGRAGLLGNVDMMDLPFASTAYTEQLIRDQQAESVGDVLLNDPVVRVARGFGNFQELYVVRGFPVYSDDMTYNGVYGILPRQFVAAEMLERVEVFRGANSFLNGAAPSGSGVGGAFNVVPKRAPDAPLTRATGGYGGRGEAYAALDVGRRFGADNAFGMRLNGAYRDGDTSVEDQERELTVLSAGVDYRGARFRFSADAGYQDNRIDRPRPSVTPVTAAPAPPDTSKNFAQPWTFTEEKQLFGAVRAEFDLSNAVTAWAAAGGRDGEEANVLSNPTSQPNGATSAYRFDNTREDSVLSADAGVRGEFETGAVGHSLVVSGSALGYDSKNAYAFSNFAGFAGDLYDPFAVAPPAPDFFVGGNLADPLKTEETEIASIAAADTLALFDGAVLATVGVRYQNIEKASFDYNTGAELSRYEEDAVTPAFGVVYKPSETISVYGNYAESLVPGETAPATSGGAPVLNAGEVFPPYAAEQYEAGVKADWGIFGGSLSVFSLGLPSAFVEDNVFTVGGEQEAQGVELSVFGEVTQGVRLLGGMTLLDAQLVRTENGAFDGNDVIGTPEFQANLNAEWDVPMVPGLTLDARVVHTSSQFADQANTIGVDSWTRLDAGVRYIEEIGGRPVTFRGRVENLTDEDYWASAGGYPGAGYLVLGAPLTAFGSISVDF
jgi:iron complex outermembrane receptor protein